MKIGKVVSAVWATRKAQCLMGQTFLVVDCGGEQIVAADHAGAGAGDRVLVLTISTPMTCFALPEAVMPMVPVPQ